MFKWLKEMKKQQDESDAYLKELVRQKEEEVKRRWN